MTSNYPNAIAEALQEYNTGTPVSTSNPLQQVVHSDLAYGSLQDAPSVFDALFPVVNTYRQRIINRKMEEQTGHPIAQGTPQGQINYGQSCN